MVYDDGFPDPWGGEGDARGFGRGFEAADGFVPGVEGEVEFAPVDGEEGLCVDVQGRLGGLFGEHMDMGPVDAVLAAFQEGEVEGAEFVADGFEVGFVAGVAAEEEVEFFGGGVGGGG